MILLAAGVLLAGKRLLIKDERNVVYLDYMIYGIFFSALIVRHSIVERFALYFMMALILTVPMMVLSLRPDENAPVKSDGKFRSDKAKAAYERGQRREQRQVYYSVLAGVCVLCFVHFLLAANYKFHNTYPCLLYTSSRITKACCPSPSRRSSGDRWLISARRL